MTVSLNHINDADGQRIGCGLSACRQASYGGVTCGGSYLRFAPAFHVCYQWR
jgi:hypothetical protein